MQDGGVGGNIFEKNLRISLSNRSVSYIRIDMDTNNSKLSSGAIETKISWLMGLCRESGLKVTPQRVAIYRELVGTDRHPSAEMLYERLKPIMPTLSFDTVNRTLLTFSQIGAAFIVEGSGDSRRFDAGLEKHQHFKCVKCKRIVDFHHEPFDEIELPSAVAGKFTVLKKTVYLEGICDVCK
jgi:Fur family peroxide stress response transcriptional regulator